MTTLRSGIIRLAHENSELRHHLLPLLGDKTAGMGKQAYTITQLSVNLANTLIAIITAMDNDNIDLISDFLGDLIVTAKIIQREIGKDPDMARDFVFGLLAALTHRLKPYL